MRLPLQEQRILPPCFAKQNATAFAGAEDFTSFSCLLFYHANLALTLHEPCINLAFKEANL